MAQGAARGPAEVKDTISSQSAGPTAPGHRTSANAAQSHRDESIAFLEAAARHLRDAGYSVDLDFDHEANEACLYVDGIEVRFVRALPPAPGRLKH